MRSLSEQLWKVRWKGRVVSFPVWEEVEEALSRGELSLIHEVEWQGRWWQIGEFLERKPWVEEETPVSVASVAEPEAPYGGTSASGEKEPFLECMVALAGSLVWLVLLLIEVQSPWLLVALVMASVLPAFWLIVRGSRKWPWYGILLLLGVAFCVLRATQLW